MSARKTFKITDSTPAYQPQEQQKLDFETSLSSDSRRPSRTHELYIQPKARSKIFEHIDWGKQTPENRVEQGGILLGHVFRDPKTGLTYGVVEAAIAADAARGTGAYLEMDHNTWKQMIDRADAILDSHRENGSQIIGWYHTHPNHLDVFMSSTDTATQGRIFAQEWQFAVVINPHQKIWRVFHGKEAQECSGFMIQGEDETSVIDKDSAGQSYPAIGDSSHPWSWGVWTICGIVGVGALLALPAWMLFHKLHIAEDSHSTPKKEG